MYLGLVAMINFWAITANAQDKELKEMRVGIKGFPSMAADIHFKSFLKYSRLSYGMELYLLREFIKDKLEVEAGFYYINRGVKTKNFVYYTDLSGIVSFRENTQSSYIHYLGYSVILKLYYKSFYIGMGLNVEHYLDSKVISKGADIGFRIVFSSDQFPPAIGYLIRGGIHRPISKKFDFIAELFFNPMLSNPFVNYGLGIGLNYNLMKNVK